MLNEGSDARGAPWISWERGMQLIPEIKLNCKEQSKNNSRNDSELCTVWNQIVRKLKCVCSYPLLSFLSPFTFFLSLIPAVLGIKKEINTPLKSPNTNNQVCYF